MRTGTDHFKETIEAKLQEIASKDELFAETLKKENKNIDECINYIFETVQKQGHVGYTDDEVFAMAVHYYDEDDIKAEKTISANVVVNHQPELNEEEKEELKAKARQEVIDAEKEKMLSKRSNVKVVKKPSDEEKKQLQPSLF